jgi:hypothetical protein
MPRFEVALHVEVEAEDSNAAFADVRTNYAVINDPAGQIVDNLVEFVVDGEPYELAEDESVINWKEAAMHIKRPNYGSVSQGGTHKELIESLSYELLAQQNPAHRNLHDIATIRFGHQTMDWLT